MTKVLVVGRISPRQKIQLETQYGETQFHHLDVEVNPFWISSTVQKDVDKLVKKAEKISPDMVYCNVHPLFDFWFNTRMLDKATCLVTAIGQDFRKL